MLFYLFHELRHATQYLRPEMFDKRIQESRFHAVLYNRTCYKHNRNAWKKVALERSEEYFIRTYLNLPHEIDTNTFAYEQAKKLCGDTVQLRELIEFRTPKEIVNFDKMEIMFRRIDICLNTGGLQCKF